MNGRFAASLVVLNLNGRRHLTPLLAHLAVQSVRDFELIFVDNGSTDGSLPLVEESCRAYGLTLAVIRNTFNNGFAPASNQGLRAARAEHVIMLNNDTLPEPAWLEHLLATAEQMPAAGMVASKMLFAHDPAMINSAGIAVDRAGIAWDWRGGEADDPHERAVVEIFGPCGGAGLYSRKMMLDLGGFDEDFFAYLEDVDLAWRARLAGWRCFYQPQARILHAHSSTLGDASPTKRFLLGRNKVWTLIKNLPDGYLLSDGLRAAFYDKLATGYGVLTRGDLASLRGRVAGLRGAGPMLAKRRAIQQAAVDIDNWRRFVQPAPTPWAVPKRYAHLAGKP